jgi:DUF971 family protein
MELLQPPEKIEVVDGRELVIDWGDGGTTQLSAAQLRAACPCASCKEASGRAQTELVLGGPVPVTIADARLVGGYALSFEFSPDGHGTGIYPYAGLRELGRLEAPG